MIQLYTQEQVAQMLGVDVGTLCRWRRKKLLTACKRGNWVRYTEEDIQRFIAAAHEEADNHSDKRRAKIRQKGTRKGA